MEATKRESVQYFRRKSKHWFCVTLFFCLTFQSSCDGTLSNRLIHFINLKYRCTNPWGVIVMNSITIQFSCSLLLSTSVSLVVLWPGSYNACFCPDEEEERWIETFIVQNSKSLYAQREASQPDLYPQYGLEEVTGRDGWRAAMRSEEIRKYTSNMFPNNIFCHW